MTGRADSPPSAPVTLVYEEVLLARYVGGLDVRQMYCSEFADGIRSLGEILSNETPAMTPREAVEREMRRRR